MFPNPTGDAFAKVGVFQSQLEILKIQGGGVEHWSFLLQLSIKCFRKFIQHSYYLFLCFNALASSLKKFSPLANFKLANVN